MRIAMFLLSLFLVCSPSIANEYPYKPVKIVIGFPAGNGADIMTRYYANQLEKITSTPFLVDNKPGANSNLALKYVSSSKPDGYTLLFISSSNMAGSRFLYKEMPVDTLEDFIPVSSYAEMSFVLVIPSKSSINNVGELIEKLKSKKNLYGYSSQTSIISSELFKKSANIEADGVAYKATSDILRDLDQGAIDFAFIDGTIALMQIEQGTLKGMAITAQKRTMSFPNLPTFNELGLNVQVTAWWCVYVPKNTPQTIINDIETLMTQISSMTETKLFLKKAGAEPINIGHKKSIERLINDIPVWRNYVVQSNLLPQ